MHLQEMQGNAARAWPADSPGRQASVDPLTRKWTTVLRKRAPLVLASAWGWCTSLVHIQGLLSR